MIFLDALEAGLRFILKGFTDGVEFDVGIRRERWLMAPEPRPPQPIQPIFSLALLGFPKVTVGKAIAAAPAVAVEALMKSRRVESVCLLMIKTVRQVRRGPRGVKWRFETCIP